MERTGHLDELRELSDGMLYVDLALGRLKIRQSVVIMQVWYSGNDQALRYGTRYRSIPGNRTGVEAAMRAEVPVKFPICHFPFISLLNNVWILSTKSRSDKCDTGETDGSRVSNTDTPLLS